jgi:hypothetical protein
MTWKPKPYSEWTDEQKAKHRETFKLRYQTDPEFREKVKARTKRYSLKNRARIYAYERAKRNKDFVIPRIGDGSRKIGTTKRDPGVVKAYRFKPKAIRHILLTGAKSRAKRLGLEFNLTLDDIIIPEKCPVFGITLEKKEGGRQPCTPSLDRVNNKLGYIKGNVRVISWEANQLKSNATLTQLKQMVAYVSSNSVVDDNGSLDIFAI